MIKIMTKLFGTGYGIKRVGSGEDGSAGLIAIFTLLMMFLTSMLLFFIYSCELGFIRDEVSEAIAKIVLNNPLSERDKLLIVSDGVDKSLALNEFETMLKTKLEQQLLERFKDLREEYGENFFTKRLDLIINGEKMIEAAVNVSNIAVINDAVEDAEKDLADKVAGCTIHYEYKVDVKVKVKLKFPQLFLFFRLKEGIGDSINVTESFYGY